MLKEKILEYTAQIDNEIDDFITVTVNRELAERNTMVNAKKIAEAVEKQIPQKVKEYEDKYYGCPVCGNVLMHKWINYPNELCPKSDGLPYCSSCGQRLDWSDDND